MADVKISGLPASTTPLAGTEVLPIVQGGATKQVSIANVTAGRAVSAASLALTTSPLPITSGGTNATATPTAGAVPYGTGTAFAFTAAGTAGQVLSSNTAAAPSWIGPSAFLNSISTTQGATLYRNSAGWVGLNPGTAGQVLTTGGAAADPSWGNLGTSAGGTGLSGATPFTANGLIYASSTSALSTSASLVFDGTNLGVGGTPAHKISAVTSGGSGAISNTSYRAAAGQSAWVSRFARGTLASPTVVLSGDTISSYESYPYNGTDFSLQTASITTLVTGVVTSLSIPTAITFNTDAGGAAYAYERMRIANTGIITMSAYGAGAATFSAAGVISSVSDETWKIKDGAPVNPDEMLQKLEPGYWFYNEEKAPIFGTERQLGFYAQNVNAAIGAEAAPIPETVVTKTNDGVETTLVKPWGYYDRSVLAITVMSLKNALNTIQELNAKFEAYVSTHP